MQLTKAHPTQLSSSQDVGHTPGILFRTQIEGGRATLQYWPDIKNSVMKIGADQNATEAGLTFQVVPDYFAQFLLTSTQSIWTAIKI